MDISVLTATMQRGDQYNKPEGMSSVFYHVSTDSLKGIQS